MSDAHWHTLMLGGLDTATPTRAILEARSSLEEARYYLADVLSALPGPPDLTDEEKAIFFAGVRVGKWDWVSDDAVAMRVYPCKGGSAAECREFANVFARAIMRGKALTRIACMCPDHVAARGGLPQMPTDVTGLFGLLLSASMFTAAMDPDPDTGMHL